MFAGRVLEEAYVGKIVIPAYSRLKMIEEGCFIESGVVKDEKDEEDWSVVNCFMPYGVCLCDAGS